MSYGTPQKLYTIDDLLAGYDPNAPMAFADSWDFKMFQTYIADGGATPTSLDVRRQQADHDAHLSDALKRHLERTPVPRLVGVMGGHSLKRSDDAYIAVAKLGAYLTERGFLVVTGGGPGAMEAAHLGAACAHAPSDLSRALKVLESAPALPHLEDILDAGGAIISGKEKVWEGARLWMNTALDAKAVLTGPPGESLAIPTWLYGNEPTIPFATHYAKFFQNSIREEALVTQSRAGIVYARGGGGTMREVFEDAEQNYYAKSAGDFTPMIFFDTDRFWQRDATFDEDEKILAKGIKLDDMLVRLFTYARSGRNVNDTKECLKKLRFTNDPDEVEAVLREHAPVAQQNLAFALAVGARRTAVIL
jgi:predicted Rossmann-fold nucleotide-binding protein